MRFGRGPSKPTNPQNPGMQPQRAIMGTSPQAGPGLSALPKMMGGAPLGGMGGPIGRVGDMGAGKQPGMQPQSGPIDTTVRGIPSAQIEALKKQLTGTSIPNAQIEALRKQLTGTPMKKGGQVKSSAKSSAKKTSSASKRGDGCATKGKTKGRMI